MAISTALYAKAKRAFGKYAWVRENEVFSTPSSREERAATLKTAREEEERLKLIKNEKLLGHKNRETFLAQLIKACQFWRDVNGGEPSSSELRTLLAQIEEYEQARDNWLAASDARRNMEREAPKRWEVGYNDSIAGLGMSFHAISCDTKAELIAKLDAEIAKKKPTKTTT